MPVLRLLAAVVAVSTPAQHETTVVFDRPLTDAYAVRVTSTRQYEPPTAPFRTVRVVLRRRAEPRTTWELTSFRAREDQIFSVERATARVLVLYWRSDPYGVDDGYVKLFLDLSGKRIDKRIDYEEPRELSTPKPTVRLPPRFTEHPLPQSTKADVMKRRRDLIALGLAERDIDGIEETIEAFQVTGDRIWFGKSFYDAEGMTGIGAIGFLERVAYVFLEIPEVVPWSVSAMLVDDRTIWAGLAHHGEGRDLSGGLLQHDRQTGRTIVHKIPDVIHSIAAVSGTIEMGTDRGRYVLRNGAITRYRMEPDIDGNFVVISQPW